MIVAYTDGACFKNPGPMGIGVAIYRDGIRVEELSEYLGYGTNNIAEYTAVIKALETARQMGETEVHIKSDSQLIVCQLNGQYKVRDVKLMALKKEIVRLCIGLKVRFEHIPREHNRIADELSKEGAEMGRKGITNEKEVKRK